MSDLGYLAEHIRAVVDKAPPLSGAQRGRLTVLLAPGAEVASTDDYADLVLRVARSDAAKALVDTAPTPTREQLAVVRTACLPRTGAVSATFRLKPDPAWLYRYYDACNCLLYVGITSDPAARDIGHERQSPWHSLAVRRSVTEFASRPEAAEAERIAVRDEKPVFNKALRRSVDTAQALYTYIVKHKSGDVSALVVSPQEHG